ncbi:MAG: hypothetical protein IH851_05265 [Armatimonadetes bacterium]|nr:hypothetical protein [Armatimonadota bacterium]
MSALPPNQTYGCGPRPWALLALGLLCAPSAPQDSVAEEFAQTRPDVIIRVQKAPTGADYVHIQMVAADYPADLLRRQCEMVGEYAGTPVRGLRISQTPLSAGPEDEDMRVLGADFATDFIIDADRGILRLLPFAKAFAGAPSPHTVRCLAIAFEGVTPQEDVTLRNAETDSATVRGVYDARMGVVEYRVVLTTQDPSRIDIPETAQQQTIPPETPSKERSDSAIIWWIAGAAALAGLLVYFALRPYRGRRSAEP